MQYLPYVWLVAILLPVTVMSIKVHVLQSPKTDIGEGLHWDVKTQSLYYADKTWKGKPTLLRYDYEENKVYSARIKNRTNSTSFIIPVKCKKDQFVVGLGRNLEIVRWDGYSEEAKVVRTVVNVEPDDFYATNDFNDAKADPRGRFYGGTLRLVLCKNDPTVANASFVTYTKRKGLVRLRSDVQISNGMTWNTEKRKFYYIDSCKFDIKSYDWDPKTGNICNEKVIFDFRVNGEDPGFIADGMTIDRDGLLWVALYLGGSVVAIDPDHNKIVRRIKLPVSTVTAAVFGGPNLDELFVSSMGTNANLKTGERDTISQPALAGRIFKVTGLKSRGYPPYKLRCL